METDFWLLGATHLHTPRKIVVILKNHFLIFLKTKDDQVCTRKKMFGKEMIPMVFKEKN
jgi:hypothetical protein